MNKNIVIFGNGGLSSVVKVYCENIGIKVSGFTVDESYHLNDTFEGLPNVIFSEVKKYFSPINNILFIAIGASDLLGFVREKKMKTGIEMGYELFSHCFLKTNNEHISLGKNTLIMPGCQVDPFVNFGDGVIVWNGATICHHSRIGDYSFIAPGATICGKVTISDHCFIGSNATIRDNLIVANQSLIGAGAFINGDTVPCSVYLPPCSKKIDKTSDEIHF